jgi:hypothetical protein
MPHVKERRTWTAQMHGQPCDITLKETRYGKEHNQDLSVMDVADSNT